MMLTPHSWILTSKNQQKAGVSCSTDAEEYDDAVEFASLPTPTLALSGHATDHIWAMDGEGDEIALRMDCGDSGFVTLSKHQAEEVISTLQQMLAGSVPPEAPPKNFFERLDKWFNKFGL